MLPQPDDSLSSLERARERLYRPDGTVDLRRPITEAPESTLQHAWDGTDPLESVLAARSNAPKKGVRLASVFFGVALLFFVVSSGIALYIFSVGGNSISIDKVSVVVDGPTSIAGGDTAAVTVTITNTNAVAIQNATLELDFPNSTRSATDIFTPYPRYTENVGTLASGETVTRVIKAALFGGTGQVLAVPVSLSYAASGSNGVFVKKANYAVTITSSPLAVTADAPTEAVSGQPTTFTVNVRSNATVALNNVVLNVVFPFGFTVVDSSPAISNSSFLLGTLAPGASKSIMLKGTLTGDQGDQKAFHFTVGTAKTAADQSLAVSYMTQDVTLSVVSAFIATKLAINGNTSANVVLTPGTLETLTLSYTNTLSTTISNAIVGVTFSGNAVNYNSINTNNGFYESTTHTVRFSRDNDPGLAQLAPGASGVGTITFSTLPVTGLPNSPSVTLTTSVSGTRVGQANVPEVVSASSIQVAKVSTAATVTAATLHSSGPFTNSGPIPPKAGEVTTYTIQWRVQTVAGALAGGLMTAILPTYVTYTNQTNGAGTFSYDPGSRTVSWNVGDIAPQSSMVGAFQVSLTPSTSQHGSPPIVADGATFAAYDRYAAVQVTGSTDPVTTETPSDPGYMPNNAIVQ